MPWECFRTYIKLAAVMCVINSQIGASKEKVDFKEFDCVTI